MERKVKGKDTDVNTGEYEKQSKLSRYGKISLALQKAKILIENGCRDER